MVTLLSPPPFPRIPPSPRFGDEPGEACQDLPCRNPSALLPPPAGEAPHGPVGEGAEQGGGGGERGGGGVAVGEVHRVLQLPLQTAGELER